MNDRELLELAAKAADITDYEVVENSNGDVALQGKSWALWEPLTDDGDALRLLVKMELLVDANGMYSRVCFPFEAPLAYEVKGNDPYAATRRAIVRAAAEIGKEMK